MANLKKQQYWFLFFITVYTLTGIAALALGNVWLQQAEGGAPRDAVISREIELGGIVAGTALVGYVGAISPLKRKRFLVCFLVLMIVVMFAELGLGGVIWFKTLRMRSLFQDKWLIWPDSLKIAFQDMTSLTGYGQCCGYITGQNIVSSGLCAVSPQSFVGCEEKVSVFADGYLRKLFTSLFGFTVVNVFVFISGVMLVQTRNDEERYIRIGKKEGRMYSNVI
ncbi:phospholipid scramblase 1 [Mortierella sp. GBA43]|nr:phospholipid scramblase 1 [Mortierella sp. GBA43]